MDIYVVQPGDTIETIANLYGVSISNLIQSNELTNPYNLVPGQTIVIAHPTQTHTVMEGDTLGGIAKAYGVTLMQLLRNNPQLSGREYIYPGETLVISYNTGRSIAINGFTYPFIPRDILIKTLPDLTYISIFNYRSTFEGDIITYYDDTEMIQTAKDFGTVPLMLTTTLSAQGDPNLEAASELLTNEASQDRHIDNILTILKEKGFYGVNMIFSYINSSNVDLNNRFIMKAASRIKSEGYLYFVTINPAIHAEIGSIFEEVDYSLINQAADGISFTHFIWGKNMEPPGPVSSLAVYKQFLDYVIPAVTPDKIRIGMPVIGYDWTLPYVPGTTVANSITLHAALDLAIDHDSIIQFDELSQAPYFGYNQLGLEFEAEHIVWFIDARTINSILELINQYGLSGKGVWNLMVYYGQMWLIINSQYDIEKLIPDNL